MQDKSNKLPYVFVEIDETDNSEDDSFSAEASILPYDQPFTEAFPGTYAQSYAAIPQVGMSVPTPYMLNTGGFAPVMQPQYPVGSYADIYSQSRESIYPLDDPYLDDDYEDYLEDDDLVAERQEVSGDAENDELNVATVVIPVFKNVDSRKNKAQFNTTGHQYAQIPILPTMSFLQALPYAYNPYKIPFVNSSWALPQMPMRNLGNLGMSPYMPQTPQTINGGQVGRNQIAQHPQSISQNPSYPAASYVGVQGRHADSPAPRNNFQKAPDEQQGSSNAQVRLPAEAREAFSSANAGSGRTVSSGTQPYNTQINQDTPHSYNRMTAESSNSATEAQTITANTDSVSVSVSVLPSAQSSSTNVATSTKPLKPSVQDEVRPSQGATPIPLPVTKGSKARKRTTEPKQPKETFQEKAMRENAEKTHTSLEESNGIDDMGKPLLDANAIATSDMFLTPASSMNESMTGFQFRSSRRKHVLMIVIVALVLALVVAAVVCVFAVWTGAATISFDESNIPSIRLSENLKPQ